MGRKTLDAGLKMSGGSWSFASYMPTFVFSRWQTPGERPGVVFVNEPPRDFIRGLRRRPGKNIRLVGGGERARDFLAADLVDQLYLGIVPVLLGEGIPLFSARFPQREFELIESKAYSRGPIALKYRRKRARKRR